MLFFRTLLLLCCSLWAVNPLSGLIDVDDGYVGTAVLPYLKLPVGARPLAMGGNVGAIEEQALQMFWNPAGIADIKGYWSSVHHAEYLGEFRHEYVAATIPLKSYGTLGFFGNALLSTPFDNARDIDEDKQSFSSVDFALGLNYAKEVIPHTMLAGVSFKYLQAKLEEVSGKGYAVDLGLEFKLRYGLRLASSLHNLSHGFTYEGGSELQEKLPTSFKVSVGRPMEVLPYSWAVGWQKSNDGLHQSNIGYEYRALDWLFLRGGYQWEWNDTENHWSRGISTGFGFALSSLTFDYGLQLQGDLGWHHSFSLHLSNLSDRYSSDYTHTESARDWFQRGNCDQARDFARLALRENPADLQAMMVLQSCERKDQLGSGDYFTLFYTSNTEGHYTPSWEEGAPLGGLSRRSSLLQKLQTRYPLQVTVDAGNSIKDKGGALDSLAWKAYKHMNYSAMSWEKEYGDKVSSLPWVSLQSSTWPQTKTFQKGNRWISVVSLHRNTNYQTVEDVLKALEKQVSKKEKRFAIEILLWDLSLEWLQSVIEKYPNFDAVVLARHPSRLEHPLSFGKTLVLSPGMLGTHLGKLTWYFKGGDISSWKHQLLPINTSIAPDPKVAALFQESTMGADDLANSSTVPYWEYINFPMLEKVEDGLWDIVIQDQTKKFHYRMSKKPSKPKQLFIAHSRSLLTFLEDGVLFRQKSNSKTRERLVKDIVKEYEWDVFENWLYFLTEDSTGLGSLKRVSPSGLSQQLLFSEEGLQDFSLHSNSAFVTYVLKKEEKSKVYHRKLGTALLTPISKDEYMVKEPKYSPNGHYLSYLVSDPKIPKEQRIWNIAVYDLKKDTTIYIRGGGIHHYSWSPNTEELLYLSGVNVLDLNRYYMKSQKEEKVLVYSSVPTRSERAFRFYQHEEELGVLVEVEWVDGVRIEWVSLESETRQVLVQKEGVFHLLDAK